MPHLVSVIVASWNGRAYLEKCLASLITQTYPEVEIIIVDNGSTDGSATWVAEHYPNIRLICNRQNLGFAAANNQGIQAGRGHYLALLNNDTWVEPRWIAEMVAAVEQDARVGMVASRMVFADQPGMINSTGICVDQCGLSWDRGGGTPVELTEREPVPVFGACAGAALYRRELFNDVGLFDEDFFAYLEDADLAWRARWRGWKAIYAPAACVYHLHSATSREGSPFKTYLLSKNKILMLAKNYPLPYLIFFLPPILFYELLSLGYALVERRGASAWRGRMAGLRALPDAWRKRRQLWARPHISAGEVFHLLESAVMPWQVYWRYQHIEARSSPRKR